MKVQAGILRLRGRRGGFTLAEVAVTLVIVSIGLVFVLQGLSQAKLVAYQTVRKKIARQLALGTLAQVEAGLYWEEIQPGGDRLVGTYAEEGYEDYSYEVVFGEDQDFSGQARSRRYEGFNSWSREKDTDRDGIPDKDEIDSTASKPSDDDQNDEAAAEPYEVVRIRVTYPPVGLPDAADEVVLERWIPWEQVYGTDQESTDQTGATTGDAGTGASTGASP